MRPGAKYYHWELHGIPLRVELGPRDLDSNQLVCANRLGVKTTIPRENAAESVKRLLDNLAKAENHLSSHLKTVASRRVYQMLEENIVVVHWCGEKACADSRGAYQLFPSWNGLSAVNPFDDEPCIVCGKPGKTDSSASY